MNIALKLPQLTDQELATLQVNTFGVLVRGEPKQKEQAKNLLPAIEAEMTTRNEAAAASRAQAALARKVKAGERKKAAL